MRKFFQYISQLTVVIVGLFVVILDRGDKLTNLLVHLECNKPFFSWTIAGSAVYSATNDIISIAILAVVWITIFLDEDVVFINIAVAESIRYD